MQLGIAKRIFVTRSTTKAPNARACMRRILSFAPILTILVKNFDHVIVATDIMIDMR